MTADESLIYFYAFRYCLGRMTYAVSDFCDEATRKITELHTKELEYMDKEITEKAKQDDWDRQYHRGVRALGWDCDREMWLKLRETIRKELKARQA